MVKHRRIILTLVIGLGIFSATVPLKARADVLGDQHSFFADKEYDATSRTQIDATLQFVSQRAYFYAENAAWNQLSPYQQNVLQQRIQTIAADFDAHIYPTETSVWGSEPQPGIDRDPKLTILLESLVSGNGGYFDSINEYPLAPGRPTNEREMIVLNLDSLTSDLMPVFLGHEFQHLISVNQKELLHGVSEDTWLNELRSEYTATLLGQGVPYLNSGVARRIQAFAAAPSESLTEWQNTVNDYAIATAFAEYITGRFSQHVLSDSLKSSATGIASLNEYFSKNGMPNRFTDVFLDWMFASYLNDPQSSTYGYARPELQTIHVRSTMTGVIGSSAEAVLSTSIKDWQPVWLEFQIYDQAKPALRLDFQDESVHLPAISALITYSDGSYDVQRISLTSAAQTAYISLSSAGKQPQKVVLAVTYTDQQTGFTSDLTPYAFTVHASLADQVVQTPVPTPQPIINDQFIRDGALIKRNNAETESYVIWGIYKRYLRPEIIKLYGQLDPSNVIPTDSATFDHFRMSNYVRYVNDPKVYAVWPDGTKHWLHMSAQHFAESGRDWNSIFVINEAELNAYRTGPDITQ